MAPEPPSPDSIFCAAVEIPSAEERDAYVARACGGDAELRRLVERLVAAHFRAGNFLHPAGGPETTAEPSASLTPPPAPPAPLEGPGTVIGPYKLLQQIG